MNYQTPRGTYDILPDEIGPWHTTEQKIREICRLYRHPRNSSRHRSIS